MSTRERKPALRGSRIPALVAALALTGPMIAAADPRDAGSRDSSDTGTSDGGAIGDEGTVRIEGPEAYKGFSVDGQARDELLKDAAFSLPAGDHTFGITRSNGSTFEIRLTVRAGAVVVLPRSECEQPLGGVAPPIEPRPAGCCGHGSTSNETAGRYGLLGTAAAAIAFARRRRRDP